MKSTQKKVWVECGRVGRPWGVKGEVVVEWYSGKCPVEVSHSNVYQKIKSGEYSSLRVLSSRRHGKLHVVRFDGILSRNEAEKLRGATLFLSEDELAALDEGEYYSYQILGLDVLTNSGEYLGKVTKIFSAGEHDIYEVTDVKEGKKQEHLIPAVEHVIEKIDLEKKQVVINEIEGLIEKGSKKSKKRKKSKGTVKHGEAL